MLRNKTRNLILSKKNRQPSNNRFGRQQQFNNVSQTRVGWEQDYYHQKQVLQTLSRQNLQLTSLINQYQSNPSVYNLRELDRLINSNCKLIDETDSWINKFSFSPMERPASKELENNICQHFRSLLSEEIKNIFQARQRIADISGNAANKDRSFNAFNQSQNISYNSLNNSLPGNDRDQTFKEVNLKIEHLHLVLRRMGAAVTDQGQLVNRIDENLARGKENVVKGKQQLKRRLSREEGEGEEFSLAGKINKAITGLYIINIILIVVFVIKNL